MFWITAHLTHSVAPDFQFRKYIIKQVDAGKNRVYDPILDLVPILDLFLLIEVVQAFKVRIH